MTKLTLKGKYGLSNGKWTVDKNYDYILVQMNYGASGPNHPVCKFDGDQSKVIWNDPSADERVGWRIKSCLVKDVKQGETFSSSGSPTAWVFVQE